MRILVLSDLFPPVAFGGYEVECAALVARLRETHEVLVLTTDLQRERAPAGEEGVERVLPFAGGDRVRAAARAPLLALRGAAEVRRVLDEFRPGLVYVSNGVSLPQAAIAIAVTQGLPVVCRFSELFFAQSFLVGDRFLRHLTPGDHGLRGVWGGVQRRVNRRGALRIDPTLRFPAAISWGSASLREVAGVPASVEPVLERVIHPGAPNAELFSAVQRRPAAQPLIAYVGRVTIAKGAEVALRTLALVRERHGLDARLVFAGTALPAVRRKLDALATELGVAAHVNFLGHLAPAQTASVFAEAGVVLLPSVEHESFGLVAIEAALAGAPVVASRVGGVSEGLHDSEHALLVDPGDAAAAAAAVARVFEHPDVTSARAARARERAHAFAPETYLDRSEELIADTLRLSGGLVAHGG